MTEILSRSCVLADLIPDECSSVLHSHHVLPVSHGGDPDGAQVWVCSRHHPSLEALTRRVLRWRTCPHRPGVHRYPGAKEECERQLNRRGLTR
jgi:hypothetical protein